MAFYRQKIILKKNNHDHCYNYDARAETLKTFYLQNRIGKEVAEDPVNIREDRTSK